MPQPMPLEDAFGDTNSPDGQLGVGAVAMTPNRSAVNARLARQFSELQEQVLSLKKSQSELQKQLKEKRVLARGGGGLPRSSEGIGAHIQSSSRDVVDGQVCGIR